MSFALVLLPRQCLADICHPIKSMPRKNWDYWSLKVNHVFLSSLSQSFGQSKTHIGNGMMTWEYWCKCRKSEEKKLEMSKKSNKCNQFGESLNQCDSASSHASNLRTHSKIHMEKVKQMQQVQRCVISNRRFEETFENTQRKKVMQAMWLCLLSLAGNLRTHLDLSGASDLRTHLKTYSGEKVLLMQPMHFGATVKWGQKWQFLTQYFSMDSYHRVPKFCT